MIEKKFDIFYKGEKTNLKFVFLFIVKDDINDNNRGSEIQILDKKVSEICGSEKQEFVDVRLNIPWMRVAIVGNLNKLPYELKNDVRISKCYICNENIISDLIFMLGGVSILTPNIYMTKLANEYKNNKDMFELVDRHLDNPWLRLLWFNPFEIINN